jgi:class 3 adenylate cyclase/ABC-type uncharacterized transport system substrate-binding protein
MEVSKKRIHVINACACFFITLLLFSHTKSYSATYEKHVLVLHSYHIGLSWTESITEGIRSVFDKERKKGLKVQIDYEYMDTKRFVDDIYYEKIFEIYKHKCKNLKYDMIISADDNALNFLLRYRDKLWGKIPVVFCGVNHFDDSRIEGHQLYTGVVEAFDVRSTIEIALKLHPETRDFIIIGDNTTTSLKDRKTVQKAIREFEKKNITFTFFTDSDVMRYQRELQKLPKGSLVIAMHVNRDCEGRFYTFEESFAIYTLNINVPVYTFWDFYMGRGALGGKIISGAAQGEEAAKKALQILHGQKVKNIPILRESPNRYMFDYNLMEKFDISLDDIPEDSIIYNKPEDITDLFHKYKRIIMGVLALVAFLLGVIVVLSFNIMKRKRVERELVKTNIAYDRFVPHAFLDNLEKKSIIDVQLGDQVQKEMTILFSDIRSFTSLSEKMTPKENFNFINSFLKLVSPIIRDNDGFIDKYIGDAVMALFPENAEGAIISAIEMQKRVIDFNINRVEKGYEPIAIGIGLHLGNLMLGTVGEEKRMEGTVISDAVNLASRLEGLTKMFGASIIISGQTLSSLEERSVKYTYRHLGQVNVKGKRESVKLFEIIDGNDNTEIELKVRTKQIFEKGLELYYEKDFASAITKFQNALKIYPEDKAAARYLEQSEFFINRELSPDWDGVIQFDAK